MFKYRGQNKVLVLCTENISPMRAASITGYDSINDVFSVEKIENFGIPAYEVVFLKEGLTADKISIGYLLGEHSPGVFPSYAASSGGEVYIGLEGKMWQNSPSIYKLRDSDGEFIWKGRIGNTNTGARGLAMSSDGEHIFVGSSHYSLYPEGYGMVAKVNRIAESGLFHLMWNSFTARTGAKPFEHRIPRSLWCIYVNEKVNNIFVDSSGYVYVVLDRNSDNKSLYKLDPSDGSILNSYDSGADLYAIYVDASDNIYITGDVYDSESVWKLNSSFVKQWGFDTGQTGRGIIKDSSGNVFVSGFDGNVNPSKIAWKLADADGAEIWSKDISTGMGTIGTAITLDTDEHPWVGLTYYNLHDSLLKLDKANGDILDSTGIQRVQSILITGGYIYTSGSYARKLDMSLVQQWINLDVGAVSNAVLDGSESWVFVG